MGNAEVDRLLRRGWRIESATTSTMVLVKDRRRVNHVAHALGSLLTLGLWLPVWVLHVTLHRRQQRKIIQLAPGNLADWANTPNARRWP
jgi:hypothetical protein